MTNLRDILDYERMQPEQGAQASAVMRGRLSPNLAGLSAQQASVLARRAITAKGTLVRVRENGRDYPLTVTRQAVGPLLRSKGRVWLMQFTVSDRWGLYYAFMNVDLDEAFRPFWGPGLPVRLRVDSGCFSGMVGGDLTCDCREQLERALATIARGPQGLVIHIPGQDGRGQGGAFKLGTLFLQTAIGCDTVAAAEQLTEGGPIDVRTYAGAIAVMQFLGVTTRFRIASMTNNPEKLAALRANGYLVTRISHVVPATVHTRRHFAAKQAKLGHRGLLVTGPRGGV